MTLQYFETLKVDRHQPIHQVHLPDGVHQHAGEISSRADE